MSFNTRPFYLLIFLLALLVNFIGINNDFFTDDPGLYASIAKNMILKKDLMQLYSYNVDWLDKPHFPFWMVYVSFRLFGISVWAYRLPALLFFLLGLLYTFLFARRFYKPEIAVMAVLIVMTAQHLLISNADVRAEPYLMALTTGSIYHIARLNDRWNYKHLLLAAVLTACAIMTKGLFIILPIYGALLGQLVFQNKLMDVFHWKWYILFILTIIFTLPELYALYIQFDLHPEKTVFGRHGVSGVRWFLWDSQFGRFANNGPIRQKKSGDVFFFMHTLLWAFAPWCLVFYLSVVKNIRRIFRKENLTEYYTLCGGLLMLVVFSVSRFQLPFYTNIIFPLFAIVTAPYCYEQLTGAANKIKNSALLVYVLLWPLAVILLHAFLKPADNLLFIMDCLLFGVTVLLIKIFVKIPATRLFLWNCCAVLFANFYLNAVLFRTVAGYNGQIAAAKYVNGPSLQKAHLYSLMPSNNVFQFYCDRPVDFIPVNNFNRFEPVGASLFYASQQTVDQLNQEKANFRVIRAFVNYPQENLLPVFINYRSRYKTLDRVYLITK